MGFATPDGTALMAAGNSRPLVEWRWIVRFNTLDWIAIVLVIVGAINWGLVGLFGFNLVSVLFGGVPVLESIIYVLVGLAGLYMIYLVSRESRVPAR